MFRLNQLSVRVNDDSEDSINGKVFYGTRHPFVHES